MQKDSNYAIYVFLKVINGITQYYEFIRKINEYYIPMSGRHAPHQQDHSTNAQDLRNWLMVTLRTTHGNVQALYSK